MTTDTMEIPTLIRRKWEGKQLVGIIVYTMEQKLWALAKFPHFIPKLIEKYNGGMIYFFDCDNNVR